MKSIATNIRATMKTVILGIVLIGVAALLSVELATAFNITDTVALVAIGLVPTLLGVALLLHLLDVF